MYILGINGSPRTGGNCDLLLDAALAAAALAGADTEKLLLCRLCIAPCRACDKPSLDGPCVVADDMAMVYERLGRADAVILASPIYFG
ncbi:MAG: NAD(P)H-dependent oxidoreductase, partial [Candidatus Aureabacteria bacterium]|nr:NAD(P)H-dependent oxidoreductase [Candidatus Auribacterota bacterium]